MEKKLEILLIDIMDRFIGIDCEEIKKVISDVSKEKDLKIINNFKKEKRFFKLSEILNINENIDYNSLIIIDMENMMDLMIAVPFITNIITPDFTDILTIPELIKKKQNPFFVWGFVKNEDKMVSLITFTSFINKG